MTEEKFIEALGKLRKDEKKTFDQTVDLIINLKEFDVRREAFNTVIILPAKIRDNKVVGFFEKDSKIIDTIKKDDFPRYKEKKDMKKLTREYDFFIANAKLMPAVATAFGRVLGPVGKMPSPQMGIVPSEDDNVVKNLVDKINYTVRVRVKEPSIKVGIGKQSAKNEDLAKNAFAVYNKIIELLPRHRDNLKNVQIKFTMSKPVKVEI